MKKKQMKKKQKKQTKKNDKKQDKEEEVIITTMDRSDRDAYYTDLREESIIIGDSTIKQRLPSTKKKINLRADSYYLNNRKIFSNFINKLFQPYKTRKEKEKW